MTTPPRSMDRTRRGYFLFYQNFFSGSEQFQKTRERAKRICRAFFRAALSVFYKVVPSVAATSSRASPPKRFPCNVTSLSSRWLAPKYLSLKNSSSVTPKPSQIIFSVTMPGFLLFPYRMFLIVEGATEDFTDNL